MDVVEGVMGFGPTTLYLGEQFDTGTAVGRLRLNLGSNRIGASSRVSAEPFPC